MNDIPWQAWAAWLSILAPLAGSLALGMVALLAPNIPVERSVTRCMQACLALALASTVAVGIGNGLAGNTGDIFFGDWVIAGEYKIPLTLRIDWLGILFATMSALLALLVARFSRTYLHRDPGFFRFFFMMGVFATGAQLVAFAGALDLMFAGWEAVGLASTLFIGFFHDRPEPIRSSIRALSTYRLCDSGFLLAVVAAHEWLHSTTLASLDGISSLPTWQATVIAALLMVSAMGKSAQLPFSGWLSRATEGPTPSSALFYGGISIHLGLFLLLRTWSVIDHSPIVEGVGIGIGLLTALYAASIARVQPDAKGALAHATLAQVGIIFAEIAAGWTTIALVHLLCHASLRVWQYLRAPNILHDAHRIGEHAHSGGSWLRVWVPSIDRRLCAMALSRWRLDEATDALVAPVLRLSRFLARATRIKP